VVIAKSNYNDPQLRRDIGL